MIKSLNLLMRTASNTEELQFPFFITDEISERVFVWFVQPNDLIFFIERKTHGRHGGSRRRIWRGKTAQRDMMIDEMLSLHFEIKTFNANPISAGIFLELAGRSLNRLWKLWFRLEVKLERVVRDAGCNDPTIITVSQNGKCKLLFW